MYIAVRRKNTPPMISTKLVENRAYCRARNCTEAESSSAACGRGARVVVVLVVVVLVEVIVTFSAS